MRHFSEQFRRKLSVYLLVFPFVNSANSSLTCNMEYVPSSGHMWALQTATDKDIYDLQVNAFWLWNKVTTISNPLLIYIFNQMKWTSNSHERVAYLRNERQRKGRLFLDADLRKSFNLPALQPHYKHLQFLEDLDTGPKNPEGVSMWS